MTQLHPTPDPYSLPLSLTPNSTPTPTPTPRFLGSGWRKQYTFWPAHALWQRSLLLRRSAAEGVTAELFPQLAANYRDWQRTHFSQKAGCLFQSCHADGQENSAGLDGCRPTVTAAQ